ncbi:MAG: hypothetical protein ACJ74O_16530 [Frankiaceae bacterium]
MTDSTPYARGPIGWGDAIEAAAVLSLEIPRQLGLLVDLLGLSVAPPELLPPVPATDVTGAAPDLAPEAASPDWEGTHTEYDDLPALDDRRTIVEELPPEPFRIPGEAELALDRSAPGPSPVPYEPPIPASLLRAAIAMLVRRARTSDVVDLDRAVELIADQRPLVALPRLAEPSTDRGAVVVADVGSSMLPYLEDVLRLVAQVTEVVGLPQVRIVWADDRKPSSFLADVEGSLQGEQPVLIVSALGAVQAPDAPLDARDAWMDLLRNAERLGADVVALVPHARSAFPAGLGEVVRLVPWDDLADIGRGHG